MFTIDEEWIFFLNLLMILIFAAKFFRGWKIGFLRELMALIGTVVSYWIGWNFSAVLAKHIAIWPSEWILLEGSIFETAAKQYLNQICWFVVLFAVIRFAFFLLDHIVKGIQKMPVIHFFSSVFGGVFGLLEGLIWIIVLTVVLNIPYFSNGTYIVENSWLKPVNDTAELVFSSFVKPMINTESFNDLKNGVDQLTEDQRRALEDWLNDNGYTQESENLR